MGDDGCAAGRGATPSEIVWVLAPVIAIICAMAFFGARRFGLIGGRPAADRRPEAFAADLVVSHPLKVIALNVWLITALSVLCGNRLDRGRRCAATFDFHTGQSRPSSTSAAASCGSPSTCCWTWTPVWKSKFYGAVFARPSQDGRIIAEK